MTSSLATAPVALIRQFYRAAWRASVPPDLGWASLAVSKLSPVLYQVPLLTPDRLKKGAVSAHDRPWHDALTESCTINLPDCQGFTGADRVAKCLVKSRPGKLEWMAQWGLLDRSWIDPILEHGTLAWAPAFWERVGDSIQLYRDANLAHRIPRALERLIPLPYVAELAATYHHEGCSEADAWYFVITNPTDPPKAIRRARQTADSLFDEFKSQGLPWGSAWEFAVNHTTDPQSAVSKALGAIPRLTGTFEGIMVTSADATHLVLSNPRDPDGALARAILQAKDLRKRYGVTVRHVWNLVIYYPSQAEEILRERHGL